MSSHADDPAQEEVKDASLTVPRVMFFTVFFNGIMGFVSALTYVYSIQDIDTQIVQSTSPFPFIGVFATATNSNAAAIGMTMPWAIIATAGCMNSIAAGSRQAWAVRLGLQWLISGSDF